jgi:hypothetical protein
MAEAASEVSMKRLALAPVIGLLLTAAAAAPVSAAAWSRAFVVDWMEPAFYHGGAGDDNTAPGTDCPKGTYPSHPMEVVLKTGWRSQADIDYYRDAEHREALKRVLRFRGPNYENVWEEPTKAPDLGLQPVTGHIGYGFNLDGKVKKTDFTTPDGEKGIDNNYYRAGGCWASYRGEPFKSQRGVGINNYMRDGLYTILIVVSGTKDPANDDDVTLGFYQGADKVVKDAQGNVASDATFAVEPNPATQSIIKASIKNGVLETKGPSEIRLRDEGWNLSQPAQLQLTQGRIRFRFTPAGGLEGLFGGYRDWKVLYRKQAVNGRDTEMNQGIDLPSFYYALQRYADADPDPKTGQNRRISTAYRLRAVPAFVVAPDGGEVIRQARLIDHHAATPMAGGANN